MTNPLPIDDVLAPIIGALRRGDNVVIEAPPGTGKTTRVPLALWRAGLAEDGDIIVLQPRRLATRMAADFVAEKIGEPVGKTCGYQVRFDRRVGTDTKIRFVTEGVLARMLRSDPKLHGTSIVVFDEFHERHVDGDIALALLRRLQPCQRPDLRIVAMSATLDAGPIASFLAATIVARVAVDVSRRDHVSTGRRSYGRASGVARARRVAAVTSRWSRARVLPGAREIRACTHACEPLAKASGFAIAPLSGELASAAQEFAVRGPATRRLILATNVAETSITIEGIAVVIDSGLARQASHDPWSALPRLELSKISRASAAQRAGRAGRTRAGRCVRLYSLRDHDLRPRQTAAEISRLDLSGVLLDLAAAGIVDSAEFAWFEAPPSAALNTAIDLLTALRAIDDNGQLTEIGTAMLRFPVHARIARFLVECARHQLGNRGAKIAAVLSEARPPPRDTIADRDADADVLELASQLWSTGDRDHRDRSLGMRTTEQIRRAATQIERLLAQTQPSSISDGGKPDAISRTHDEALRMALLVAFPDRVGMFREDGPGRRTLVFARGGSAELSPASVVRSGQWAIAIAVQDHRGERGRSRTVVWSACSINPEWLVDLFPDAIGDETVLSFDETRERVVCRSELRYGALCIEALELNQPPPQAASLLARHALSRDPAQFSRDARALARLRARLRFASEHDADCPALTDEDLGHILTQMCSGRSSFEELRQADLLAHVELHLGHDIVRRLDVLAPARIRLAGGRQLEVRYEPDRPPWVSSRLQDFFGSKTGPSLLAGRVPVVMHLLAPNQRAVQVTTDLAGFWERHYPPLRRQLCRRYPKHAWPEDPVAASPPAPRRR